MPMAGQTSRWSYALADNHLVPFTFSIRLKKGALLFIITPRITTPRNHDVGYFRVAAPVSV